MCFYTKMFQICNSLLNKAKGRTLESHNLCIIFLSIFYIHGNHLTTKFYTLDLCFLLMAGDAGWPGLGTPLEAADPAPEWRRAERSSADSTPRPPDPIPGPTIPGACCWETFCSSAANCFGSTPGERCPPAQTNGCTDWRCTTGLGKSASAHARIQTRIQYIPALSWTWCSRACGCSGSDSIFRSLFGSIQEIDDYITSSVISHRVIFVRWSDAEDSEGGVHQCRDAILQININIAVGQRGKRWQMELTAWRTAPPLHTAGRWCPALLHKSWLSEGFHSIPAPACLWWDGRKGFGREKNDSKVNPQNS